jgi:hypothetical protein
MVNDDVPMSADKAAKFIGKSYPTFRKIVASGQGPASTQIGDCKPKYRPSALRSWLDACTKPQGAA